MAFDPDHQPKTDPVADLERGFIGEFLERHGHTIESVRAMPQADADRLMSDASRYASGKLAEVESRAHLVHDLRHVKHPKD